MKSIKRTTNSILAVITLTAVTGCAVAPVDRNYSLIDPKGVNWVQYQSDYDECSTLANQTDVGDRAAGGAVFGALLGAVIGGLLCGRDCVTSGAAGGMLGGTAGATTSGVHEQQLALRRCLSGRGYQIIR